MHAARGNREGGGRASKWRIGVAAGLAASAATVAAFAHASHAIVSAGDRPSPTLSAASGLSLHNSNDGAAIVSAAGMKPGDSVSGEVTISNTGDAPGAFTLAASNLVDSPGELGGPLSAVLHLVVDDVTAPGSPATVYTGDLATMGSHALGVFGPGESRRYRFRVRFPDTGEAPSDNGGDNVYKGSAVTVQFDWTASDDSPPPPPPPPPPTDSGAPRNARLTVVLTGSRSQYPLRRRRLVVLARCSVQCMLRANVRLSLGRRTLSVKPPRARKLPAARRVRVEVRLRRAALASLRRALARGRPGSAVVTARATDRLGRTATAKLRVRLRR